MGRKRRVGILGLGTGIGIRSGARAPEYPHVEPAGAAWHDAAQLEAFTSTFGAGYADYAELLEREAIDIAYIAAPVAEIPDLAIMSANAGKHMVLGKPMAMTIDQADRMVDAVERAGVVCMPFQGIMRLRAGDVKARVDRGDIGEPILIHQTSRWSIAEDWYQSGKPGWFADPKQVPGGAFIDEGIYWIDLFRWLAERDHARRCDDAESRSQGSAGRGLGMATFTMANGLIATLEAAWTITAAPLRALAKAEQRGAAGGRRHAR